MNSNGMFILDPDRLASLAESLRGAYIAAKPFPHIVIDDFLPEEVLRKVANSFPKPGEINWYGFDNWRSKKLAVEDEELIEDNARWLLHQLNSSTLVKFLETLTGVNGLIPDPHFKGGGLHQIERGGFLKIHADFNRHESWKLDRRINLILYLNEGWKKEYGGHLELWSTDMTRCVHRILPIFNRCVIFNTTDFSYHGHPEPLTCPKGQTRKSLALYYYSNGRPSEEIIGDHGTLIKLRPGESPETTSSSSMRAFIKRFVPPIVMDVRRYLSKR